MWQSTFTLLLFLSNEVQFSRCTFTFLCTFVIEMMHLFLVLNVSYVSLLSEWSTFSFTFIYFLFILFWSTFTCVYFSQLLLLKYKVYLYQSLLGGSNNSLLCRCLLIMVPMVCCKSSYYFRNLLLVMLMLLTLWQLMKRMRRRRCMTMTCSVSPVTSYSRQRKRKCTVSAYVSMFCPYDNQQ